MAVQVPPFWQGLEHEAVMAGKSNVNSDSSSSSTTYNSVVTYSCDVGYTLQGSNSITCLSNGQWSGSVPQWTCKLLVFSILIHTVNICH